MSTFRIDAQPVEDQVSRLVNDDIVREPDARLCGWQSIALSDRGSISGDRGDDLSIAGHPSNAMVSVVGDIEIAVSVEHHIGRASKRGLESRSAIPSESCYPAGNRGDDPGVDIHPADPRRSHRSRVGNYQVAPAIECETPRVTKPAGRGRQSVADSVLGIAASGVRDNHARAGVNFTNAIFGRYVDISCHVDGHAGGTEKFRLGSRATIAQTAGAAARDGRHHARPRVDFSDAMVVGVGDVQIARGVENGIVRQLQQRLGGRLAIADGTTAGNGEDRLGANRSAHRDHQGGSQTGSPHLQ